MSLERGVAGVAREVTAAERGVAGVARKITHAERGVSGVARRFFNRGYSRKFLLLGTDNTGRVLNDAFYGADGAAWRFYLNSTGTTTTTNNPHRAVVDITGNLGGKTVEITAKRTATNIVDDPDIDAAKAVWWGEDGSITEASQKQFYNAEHETYTFTLPGDAVALRIGVWLASARTAQIELVVTELKIDGESIM